IANHDNNQHAANENLRLQNLWDAVQVYVAIFTEFDGPRAPRSAAAHQVSLTPEHTVNIASGHTPNPPCFETDLNLFRLSLEERVVRIPVPALYAIWLLACVPFLASQTASNVAVGPADAAEVRQEIQLVESLMPTLRDRGAALFLLAHD